MKKFILKIKTAISKAKRYILREWYKCYRYSTFYQVVYGKFKVEYPDGKLTHPMDYDTAKNYSEIFGGKIIDNF